MKNIIRKLIIITMLLTLVGCSSQQDSINKDINENNGSYNQVEFVQVIIFIKLVRCLIVTQVLAAEVQLLIFMTQMYHQFRE